MASNSFFVLVVIALKHSIGGQRLTAKHEFDLNKAKTKPQLLVKHSTKGGNAHTQNRTPTENIGKLYEHSEKARANTQTDRGTCPGVGL
jgi:hypothetical protein